MARDPTTAAQSLKQDKVIVIDFGSQVTHLICRRVRELGAYSELISCREVSTAYLDSFQPKAVILSGGPSSVYEKDAPHLKPEVWTALESMKMCV